jgi:hypothetical protein
MSRLDRRHTVLVTLVGLACLLGMVGPAPGQEPPVFWGIYTPNSFFTQAGPSEVRDINTNYVGDPAKAMAIIGTFIDFEFGNAAFNVPTELEGIWDSGGIPFANVSVGFTTPTRTAAQIAAGAIDGQIAAFADAYKSWVMGQFPPGNNGGRRAFLAPLQEANFGGSYGLDPVSFKLAFARIRQIFDARGVPRESVRWVFAPNGQSAPVGFEAYYPGNALVDVVAFSAYNFGFCVFAFPSWDVFELGMLPYLDRMRAMAPSKPIFIAQTGCVPSQFGGDKNLWLQDTYTKLAGYPALRAVIYFHFQKIEGLPCDPVEWRFFAPAAGINFPGLRNALLAPANGFGYWAPTAPEWSTMAFAPGPGGNTFEDVEPAHPFAGVPNVFYYDAVEKLVARGVSGGCSTSPPLYCPEAMVTREQMAVFLLKSKEGGSYTPPPCTAAPFADVPCSSPFAAWIQELVKRGITAGCGAGNYCPGSPVTREQMAVFLVRTREGAGFVPPPCTQPTFTDVPCSGLFAAWVQQLVADGITSGCAPGLYCPTTAVTRGQMAVFLANTFGL